MMILKHARILRKWENKTPLPDALTALEIILYHMKSYLAAELRIAGKIGELADFLPTVYL